MQTAINRDDLTSRLGQLLSNQQAIGLGLVRRSDRGTRERAICVELRKFRGERVRRLIIGVGDAVFCK